MIIPIKESDIIDVQMLTHNYFCLTIYWICMILNLVSAILYKQFFALNVFGYFTDTLSIIMIIVGMVGCIMFLTRNSRSIYWYSMGLIECGCIALLML